MDNKTLKRVGIWVAVAAALGLMVWWLALLGSKPTTVASEGTIQDPVTVNDHAEGGTLAKNILIEYSDFQCPACALYYPLVKQIAATYGERILIVYRYFPLTTAHANADISARAAEAASRQGKFWEMHNLLFERQKEWSPSPDPTNLFINYVTELGLNKDQFVTDLKTTEVEARVQTDLASGRRANVDATPTFYLNGKKLTNLQAYGDLEQDIKDAIK